jgi:hypothetical protein
MHTIEKICTSNKLRLQFALALALLSGIPVSAQVVITPSTPPAVNQGATFKFNANTAVAWSCPGCVGTIDPDGTYHAPQSVKSQQSYGGYQALPNNHVYNSRIDSFPVNANSTRWIAGAGTIPVNYLPSFPINYVNSTTPVASQHFNYTPGNDGGFQMPQYPTARVESGWFVNPVSSGDDKHLFSIDITSGIFQEMYQLFITAPPGQAPFPPCPTCTADSGVRYANSTYNLPNAQGGSTDAAGLYVMPLTLRLQELEQAALTGGAIKHALRFTLNQGYCASSFIWPATAFAPDGGTVPFGARFRLKSSFNLSSFSPIAQILLTELKQYGIILADGGYGWQITTEYTRWPSAYRAAFDEIRLAGIGPSNFEAVDESGLEVSPTSGLTPNGETVVATSVANPSLAASQQVVLTGVTITLPKDNLFFQAGASSQQLLALINGASNGGATWSMTPTVGTLTPGGLYTPPATVGAATTATVTATTAADSSVSASLTLTVFPAGTIRLVLGQPNPYTDTNGNVWQNKTGDDGCLPYDNGGTWPNTPDITLYKVPCYGYNDIRFDITVPNGSYQITGKFAETEDSSAGSRLMNLEAQGQVVYPNVDVFATTGGLNKPKDFTLPATVTNGSFSFVVRSVADKSVISALQIVPTSLTGNSPPTPPQPPPTINILNVK